MPTVIRNRFAEIALGVFLFYYSAVLIPYAEVLYGSSAAIPPSMTETAMSQFSWIFQPLNLSLGPEFILVLASLSGLALVFNFRIRIFVPLSFFLQWYLYNRNSYTFAPDTGFTQALLLIWGLSQWITERQRLFLAWFSLGVGYTFSGLSKLDGTLWTSGRAIRYFLNQSDSVRLWVPDFADQVRALLTVATFAVLLLEIFALPMLIHRYGRLLIWSSFLTFHLLNIAIFDFVQLSVGCALAHLLVLQWSLRGSKDFRIHV